MPVLTLSTDIGQSDYITGAIKGQLITALPSSAVTDITHYLSPTNYQQAAYICKNAFKFFERTPKHILFAEYNKQYIICPDNGILTMITGEKPKNIFAINTNGTATLLACTQQIAQTVQKISSGETIQNIGLPVLNIDEKYPMRSTTGPDWIESQIIFIDNF